jgi:hypothetical protein
MIKRNLSKEFILHPINIILIFIINTSSQKTKAGLSTGVLEPLLSIIVISVLSLLAYFSFRKIVKDRIKAALILSYTLLVVLFFRDIVEFIIYFGISEAIGYVGEYFIVIVIALIIFALIIKWLTSSGRELKTFNTYINLLTSIFLTIEIIGCSFSGISKVSLKEKIDLEISANKNKPDTYFILLDGYTGFTGLKKFWNYDNGELKNFLSEKNFYVAENGKSVYNVTNYSMASTLNMTELIFNREELYSKSNYLLLSDFIKNNSVAKYLYKAGYEFYNLSFWDINDKNKHYEDIYFLRRGNIYQARTLYGHLYEIYNEKFADMAEINPGIFNKLVELHKSSDEKPKFVYAHITMPHPPYYFDADGNRMDYSYSGDKKDMNKYLEQLKYTNKLLMNTVSRILSYGKEEPPIIVIQSDHGFRSYEGKNKMEMEYSVLNCFYFPDQDYLMLNDSIKTINTFRIIFNKYFNQNLPIIK